jgi:16S rRNA (guanine966-N2)-methyltransferase
MVFCDPPYGRDLAPAALASAAAGGWLEPGALAVVEEASSATLVLPLGFSQLERRPYGETAVVFARFTGVA